MIKQFAIENCPVEIVSFPIRNGDLTCGYPIEIFHGFPIQNSDLTYGFPSKNCQCP